MFIASACVLAIAGSAFWIYRHRFAAPKFNVVLHQAVGRVMAEETAPLIQNSGKIVIVADELRILHQCLAGVRQSRPELSDRLERILEACDRLGASIPASKVCGIHRDFYPAQVIVDGNRLCLIDFDLYCLGDPALDAGNFLGHMIEESVRTLGDSAALNDRVEAMEERFAELSGQGTRQGIRAYTTLTLVRHIYLSTQFPERTPFTDRFVDLCEERLGMARRKVVRAGG